MNIKEITTLLEKFAPLSLQENYDNAGLIVGSATDEVSGILICLDSTEEIVDEAIEKNCNLIIAHHPIIFSGLKKLNGKNYIERTIIKAIKNNIAIYAAHTNMDNAFNGVSFKMAEKLGLINCQVLLPKNNLLKKIVTFCPIDYAESVRNALFANEAGSIGNYSACSFNTEGIGTFKGNEKTTPFVGKQGQIHYENEIKIETIIPAYQLKKAINAMLAAHPYEEVAYDVFPIENAWQTIGSGIIGELSHPVAESSFLEQIKTALKTNCIRHTPLLGKKIQKVALCGGSGSFLLPTAIQKQADIFISADFKYHQFFDADNQLIIADIGHYESEQFTSELFYEILTKKIPNFAIHLSEKNTNPINYL
ncbi:MAG: Nif3-like dinuclear metal center hexameric protein [Vicingaceae bacterium]|nr:Nif3-like dinuclear metal center hexameric protein [Vicingaceae bacterium]